MVKALGLIITVLWMLQSVSLRAESFGAWDSIFVLDEDRNGHDSVFNAATTNHEGAILSQTCKPSSMSCAWLLITKVPCVPGSIERIQSGSNTGLDIFTLACENNVDNGFYVRRFRDFHLIDFRIKESTKISFAVLSKIDEITIAKFSLNGAFEAVNHMRGQYINKLSKINNLGN